MVRAEKGALAALRAGQAERLRHAAVYRACVGDPVDILTTLLPLPHSDLALHGDEDGRDSTLEEAMIAHGVLVLVAAFLVGVIAGCAWAALRNR